MIGWSADARMNDIGQVVCNNRFLLLPSVRVHGLASRVLRPACARIADDWSAACGVRPVLVQSFTGPQQSGPSWRAAGRKCCPQPTSGRPRGCEGRSGCGRWRKAGEMPCAGRSSILPAGPDRWFAPADGLHGNTGAARIPMDASGGGLPGWAVPGYGIRASICRRSSPEGRSRQQPGGCCPMTRCAAERLVPAMQDTTTPNHDGLLPPPAGAALAVAAGAARAFSPMSAWR